MITIYTTGPSCPRCEQLHKWLGKNMRSALMIADLTSPKIIAELRCEDVHVMEGPILRKGNDWYLAEDLFPGGKLDEVLMRRIVGEKA